MKHKYKIDGMTCANCEAKVKSALLMLPGVTSVKVSKADSSAEISMDKHISLAQLQSVLSSRGNYSIQPEGHRENVEQAKGWLKTYKPLLILFAMVISLSTLASMSAGSVNMMSLMQYFMAGFFLSFSYFKLIDLKGFAESYAMYDVVAQKSIAWGYIYPFIELALGFAYLFHFDHFITNLTAFTVMSVSLIGVLKSVFSGQTIQCACLGVVFNLPMSSVTIVEDALMVLMSAAMLIMI